jgi:CheY-like chemotaxis protein
VCEAETPPALLSTGSGGVDGVDSGAFCGKVSGPMPGRVLAEVSGRGPGSDVGVGPSLRALDGGAGGGGPGRLRLVIADDNATLRLLLSTILSLEPDFDVVGEAADGQSALGLAERDGVDLLVLDLSMPGLDGLDVVERLASSRPRLAVVVYTGVAGGAVVERARALGVRDVIIKGVHPSELVERVRAAGAR